MNTYELQMIIKAAELVNSNIRVDQVLKNIVDVAANLTNADRGTLYIIDKKKNELWSLIAMGTRTKEIRLKLGEGLAGYVAKSGKTINIKDVQKDPRFKPEFDRSSGYITKSMICFPIKNNKSEIIGVLQLLNSHNGQFTKRDEKFLIALSIHSAIAINNARMLQRQIGINEELKKAYKELELAKQEAEKLALLKSHFLSQMSHEIRTPFNIILGSIELLKYNAGSIQGDNMELFQMLESGSQRIIRTIDEIIEISKIRSGNYELHFEPIKLEEDILNRVTENYKESAAVKCISLIYENCTDKNEIECDKFMIYQIVKEIVDNAVKFTEKGTVNIKKFLNDDGKLSISVKDTGVGISTNYLKHIFEPFTQEETGFTRKYEGNGLALALVKKYAELNNLSVSVRSEKNVGSEFTIVFN